MGNLKLLEIQPLFYSPLAIFELDDCESLNTMLLAEIAVHRHNSPGVRRSNVNGWQSEKDLFHRTEPGFQALCRHIVSAVHVCTETLAPGFDFNQYKPQVEGWINLLDPAGLNAPHDHVGWVWSGSYYVRVPTGDTELSGSIEFLDNRTNIPTLRVGGASCFTSKWSIMPRAGTLLIFPSYLRHWVHPNNSKEARVTVAFNARFGKLPR